MCSIREPLLALIDLGPVADCVINVVEPAEAVAKQVCDHDPGAIMIN
jgi:hypothetical protein